MKYTLFVYSLDTLQESFDLSDESDIEETATEKAFVVSSDQSSKWQGQIDVNDNPHHRSRETLLQKSLAGKSKLVFPHFFYVNTFST